MQAVNVVDSALQNDKDGEEEEEEEEDEEKCQEKRNDQEQSLVQNQQSIEKEAEGKALKENVAPPEESECEMMLRNVKRQVKQMMEEAVTRKVIYEESASVLSLCVAVDVCLSHKLRRRSLGLFKTSSSTALVRKIARDCSSAASVLCKLDAETKLYLQLLEAAKKRALAKTGSNGSSTFGLSQQSLQQTTQAASTTQSKFDLSWKSIVLRQTNSTASVSTLPQSTINQRQQRNAWIRVALVSKQLVQIVDYLAEKAARYYEPDALMSNILFAHLLASLLVGPSALEICTGARSNDWPSFDEDEPSAAELLKRRTFVSPATCLCLSRGLNEPQNNTCAAKPGGQHNTTRVNSLPASSKGHVDNVSSKSPLKQQQLLPFRRRSLAVRSSATRMGASQLVATDCHHCACQELDERHLTEGYSLTAATTPTMTSTNNYAASFGAPNSAPPAQQKSELTTTKALRSRCASATAAITTSPQGEWPPWSPRALHDALHQTTRSSLLYAKNNVSLESTAGHLSLHKTCVDVVLKWIPNHMIRAVGGEVSNSICSTTTNTNGSTTTTCTSTQYQQQPQSSEPALVLSVPMARVALLHCQFAPTNSTTDTKVVSESLTLVEADGLRQAPFSFPIGGLRAMLARLDAGLQPDRRLEPPLDVNADCGHHQQTPTLAINSNKQSHAKSKSLEVTESSSRFDELLKFARLSSSSSAGAGTATTSSARGAQRPLASRSADGELGEPSHSFLPINCIFRLVGCNSEQASVPITTTRRFGWIPRLSQKARSGTTTTTTSDYQQSASSNMCSSSPTIFQQANNKSTITNDESVQLAFEQMRRQILTRALRGWHNYCSEQRIVRTHLAAMLNKPFDNDATIAISIDNEHFRAGLTWTQWRRLSAQDDNNNYESSSSQGVRLLQLATLVYNGGIEDDSLRQVVWPHLLGHYNAIGSSKRNAALRNARDLAARKAYECARDEWRKVEAVVRKNDAEILAENMARVARQHQQDQQKQSADIDNNNDKIKDDFNSNRLSEESGQSSLQINGDDDDQNNNADITDTTNNNNNNKQHQPPPRRQRSSSKTRLATRRRQRRRRPRLDSTGSISSSASITDQFGNNMHRIDKDVQRCDRTFWYFKREENLDKLRNIMCSYVWLNLDVGYVQGMCDLAAPLLVIFDDEVLAFACFGHLMKRMLANFPGGTAMDEHLTQLRHLMQVFDPKLFEALHENSDQLLAQSNNHHHDQLAAANFYFCYRWLLLDFKREFSYQDVYKVWEVIWAAQSVASEKFVVFIAHALIRLYRDIIIGNQMDHTDTIKFFNEMAERHDASQVLYLARDCLEQLKTRVKNMANKLHVR